MTLYQIQKVRGSFKALCRKCECMLFTFGNRGGVVGLAPLITIDGQLI